MSYWLCKGGVCVCVCASPPVGLLLEVKTCQILFADVLHRRRPGPKGDWTNHHPWGDCGPTRGELCWSRAHHHISPTHGPCDPDWEHRFVKKRGSSENPPSLSWSTSQIWMFIIKYQRDNSNGQLFTLHSRDARDSNQEPHLTVAE